MSKPVIALDVDGVIRDIATFICNTHNEQYPANPVKSSSLSSWNFPELDERFDWRELLFENRSGIVQRCADEYPNAFDQVKRYADKASLVIVSNQANYVQQSATLDWLRDYGYDKLVSGIVFIKDKTKIRADYLIDDFPGNINSAWSHRSEWPTEDKPFPVMVERGWNKNSPLLSEDIPVFPDVGTALSYCCD